MAGPASDYHRGDMDIREQRSTYHLVMGMTKWGSLAIAASVLFLAMNFCTDAGFLGSFVTALVVVIVGVLVLKEKPSAGH